MSRISAKEPPRVMLLTFTRVVDDPRILRHIDALRTQFDVISCGAGPKPPDVSGHLRIPDGLEHLPMTPAGLVALGMRRHRAAARQVPAARAAAELLTGKDFDVLLANDIATLPVGLSSAAHRPVVMDLHEYAPREMEEDWRWRFLVQPFVTSLARDGLPLAAAVTTVADGIAEEYGRNFGVSATTVTNAGPWRQPMARPVGGVIRAVHSGMAAPNRKLERMITAAASVPNLIFDLFLVPSSRRPRYLKKLQGLARETPNVRIRPPVPMSGLPATLDDYDVGLYSLPATNFNNLHALPNKFFDFVQSGLGIVVGPSPEMADLVTRFRLGRVLKDFEMQSLREALLGLSIEEISEWKRKSSQASRALSSETSADVLRQVVWEAIRRGNGPNVTANPPTL